MQEYKVKIGLLAYDLSTIAGGTNLALTLGSELQKEGCDIAFACVYEDLNNLAKKFNITSNFKIFKSKTPIFGKVLRVYNSLFNHSFPIYKMCKEYKPDVVIESGGLLLSLVIPVLFRIPAIYYCMEPQMEYSRGSIFKKIYFTPYSIIEKQMLKHVKVCAISNYTGQIIQKSYGCDVTIIHPPAETNIFTPDMNKENIILCVLRFRSVYKFENLIDAFRRMNRSDYSLVIIGGVTEENEAYYNFLNDYIRNDKNINLLPNADFSQLLDYYKKSKFFWYPTGSYYGIVIAEAQSAGLPSIIFGIDSGPGEIIQDGKTGFCVSSFDEMVEKTLLLIEDTTLLDKMSKSARENAVERFGRQVFVDKFKEVIAELKSKN